MAEESVTTTKTDPKEAASRKAWQDEVSSQLNADAMTNAMFVNQMKSTFDKQDSHFNSVVRGNDQSNELLTSVGVNTLRTANLFADYLEFTKDAERKRLEAAMEAARQKKGGKGGKDGELATKKDEMEDSWSTLSTILAGTLATMGAGFLAFKTKWGSWWSDSATTLDEMGKPKAGFFKKLKGFFGFGDDA